MNVLPFSNVTKEDEGWYHCEAFNEDELIKSEPAFLLLAGTELRKLTISVYAMVSSLLRRATSVLLMVIF